MTTEQFTRLQTSFVVLGTLLKSGCLPVTYGRRSHYTLGTKTFTNTVGLVSYFSQDHVARRLQGFHVTPQANESQWKFSVSPPV